ncbi:MAG: hypothetical protein ACRC6V_01410 [Bacteroidales bacterium]
MTEQLTDNQLNELWAKHFGHVGSFAEDKDKLDLKDLTSEQMGTVGKAVAYYYPATDNVFTFYMQILTIPNRVIMETLLKEIQK